MLLRIHVSQVRLGMFVEEFEGAWHDNPFWRNSLRLTEPRELEKLRRSPVQIVRIDLSKGVGPLPPTVGSAPQRPVVSKRSGGGVRTRRQGARNTDIMVAAAMLKQTTQAVSSLFATVRSGGAVDAAAALAVVDDIESTMRARPLALLDLARLKTKDEYSYRHSVAVCALVVHFARYLGLEPDEIRRLGLAAMLHDIGKLSLPCSLLGKPGKLTDEERVLVETHPREGWQILLGEDLPDLVRDICLHHHERIDGTGYPDGLSGDAIGLALRIVSICDVFDALTSIRPYKTAWAPEVAIERMGQWHGQFDPSLLQRFGESLGLLALPSQGAVRR